MHFSTLIAVVAPAIITVSAKCYNNDGAGWGGSRQSANNAADAVCYNGDGGLAGNFAGTKSACRNIGDNLKALCKTRSRLCRDLGRLSTNEMV